MAHSNLKQPMGQNSNVGGSLNHSRSLSQPTFFANNCLPPLSPFPLSETSLASSNSKNLKDISMEEIDVSSRPPMPPSFQNHQFRGNDSCSSLPPRKGHRRSNSDIPLGFSAMIQSSPQLVPISGKGIPGKFENMGENNKPAELKMRETDMFSYGKNNLEGFGDKKSEGEVVDELFNSFMNLGHMDKGSVVSGIKISGDNFESESVFKNGTSLRDLGVKRSATGDIAPPARHYRSLSMDSGIGKFHLGDESPKLHASPCRADQLSPSNSFSDNSANKLSLDFTHGEFNELEIKKIMADERLAEIAVSDPKRAKRVLANRQSAARSKERKLRYISELEHKVQTLQTEATTLSAQVTILQKDYAELTSQNNELKFRLQAMKQQAELRDALHEALNAEVQRLKLANMELRDETSNTSMQQQNSMKHQLFPLQQQRPNQMQSSQTSSTSTTTTSTAPV